MGCSSIPYNIDLPRIIDAIDSGARRVVLQMPDGLKQYSSQLVECLEELLARRGLEAELMIHMDHNYGACDLQYGQLWSTIRPDLIVHIGHSPYPSGLASPSVEPREIGVRVIYVPAVSLHWPGDEVVGEAARLLEARGVRRVGVVTTSQHVHRVRHVAGLLRGQGLEAVVPRGLAPYFSDGQVLGCDYRLPRRIDVDGFLYVGGGVFHPLGLYLATLKPVVKLDPYEGKAEDLTGRGERLYKVRMYKVGEAMDARRWGIIVGVKTGQYRPWLVGRLKKLIREHGGKYRLLASENMSRETLVAVDSSWYEAFTVTSCPRLPTDDYWDYHKPVLTPGEAVMALTGRLEPYLFPW